MPLAKSKKLFKTLFWVKNYFSNSLIFYMDLVGQVDAVAGAGPLVCTSCSEDYLDIFSKLCNVVLLYEVGIHRGIGSHSQMYKTKQKIMVRFFFVSDITDYLLICSKLYNMALLYEAYIHHSVLSYIISQLDSIKGFVLYLKSG